jgi:hypothetical protein
MLQDRNILSHVYDESNAGAAIERIHIRYIPAIVQVHAWLNLKI